MELWTKLYRERKEFLIAVLIGALGHFVKLITYLPTWDSMYGFHLGWVGMAAFGRWFSGISGVLLGSSSDLQWVEGTVAIIFFALTILTILEILDIQAPHIRILAITLFMFFPSITGTLIYMLWAAPYAFAYFLAVYALYLCVKGANTPCRLAAAVLCVAFSCGIYQIYLTSAGIVFLYFLIKKLLNHSTIRPLLKTALITGAVFALGMVLYLLLQKIQLRVLGIQLSSYQGISRIGQVNSHDFLDAFNQTIQKLNEFYFGTRKRHVYFLLDVTILAVVFFTWLYTIISCKPGLSNTVLIILLLAAAPLLSYCLMFVTVGIHYHVLMEGGNYFVYLGFLMLLDAFPPQRKRVSAFGMILIGLLCYYHFINNNTAYKQLEMSYQTTLYQSSEILNHINNVTESAGIENIAIIGRFKSENPFHNTTPHIAGASVDNFLRTSFHFCQFSNHYFGRYFIPAEDEIQKAIMDSEEFAQMDSYPYGEYVKVIENTIVVKLNCEP